MDSDSDYQPETDVDSSDDEVWELIDSSDDSDDENIPPNSTLNATQPNVNYGYDVLDTMPEAPASFLPERVPGIQLDQVRTRDSAKQFFRAIDFFKLYFTMDIVLQICQYTNTYATEHGLQKPSVFQSWYELSPDEFYRFCGLIMYAGIVQVPNIERFWSTKSLYNGLWARAFMSRDRFKAIMCFIKVSNPLTEDPNDKLCKVRMLTTYIRMKCIKLYQPHQNVSIDERMVRNKGKYAFRQYIRDKPTKWGMKLWILADSLSGYTYDFDIYLGKQDNGPFGLAYGVVMKLTKSISRQGYRLFFDNFYTSVQLLKDLWFIGIGACGTVLRTRKGFPNAIKDVKNFEKKSKRGDMRWIRDGQLLTVQWRDNKTISLMSTIHDANDSVTAKRRTKTNGQFENLTVNQPTIVHDYNKYMGGVDKSDQLINKYNVLRKTNKYWKTIFFHMLDIARVNSYILFQDWRDKNKDVPELKRPTRYGQLNFTEELIRELGDIGIDDPVPIASKPPVHFKHAMDPQFMDKRGNCKLCYSNEKIVRRTSVKCKVCDVFLCFQKERNCLSQYHKLL
ncbi:piggyBac transposable element-derived protein 4-like [Biomphalaria glabrata]|uniref:PiggyBac transposable element-derived protein 4-like n=2 Tax=Biomphalaria glabrata TaxID=6526 RepID=A0A9W3BPI8_BIOGL|nr:piggyBac transposable element-derived protein 4-like [Biomphalaria glabrata]XP_055901316.1 piggyBac transposable element-derived protein 4-like [Biomphalaria glabrata]